MTGPTAPSSFVGSPKIVPMRVCWSPMRQVSLPEYRLLVVWRLVVSPMTSSGPCVIWVSCELWTWS
jgi:hypothetical protein